LGTQMADVVVKYKAVGASEDMDLLKKEIKT
jgi:hypothetical protein